MNRRFDLQGGRWDAEWSLLDRLPPGLVVTCGRGAGTSIRSGAAASPGAVSRDSWDLRAGLDLVSFRRGSGRSLLDGLSGLTGTSTLGASLDHSGNEARILLGVCSTGVLIGRIGTRPVRGASFRSGIEAMTRSGISSTIFLSNYRELAGGIGTSTS